MTFDYKKYSLERLEEWMYDALSSSEASPQEIYDVIKGVVEDQYQCFKKQTNRCYELLALLNGNGIGHIQAYDDYIGSTVSSVQYTEEELNAMCDKAASDQEKERCHEYNLREAEYYQKNIDKCEDKVKKWVLPVESDSSGEYFITFPDDFLEAADLKEDDVVEWVDNKDGSFSLKKCKTYGLPSHDRIMEDGYKSYEDAVKDGWSMTDDGFWIKE